MSCTKRLAAAVVGLLALATAALGAAPVVWVQAGVDDFAAGDPEAVAIGGDASLRLAPALESELDPGAPRLWAVATGSSGEIYAAIGEEGIVMRFDPDTTTGTALSFGTAAVQSLVIAGDGTLYAGAQGGAVYRLPDAAGASSSDVAADPWVELEAEYLWDLVVGPGGSLFVATGGDGRVVRVAADGTQEDLFVSGQEHVKTLAAAGEDTLLAGTGDDGLVVRIQTDGTVFVLFDAPLPEITDILFDGSTIWAGAFGSADSGNGSPPAASAPSNGASVVVTSAGGAGGGNGVQGAVYRFDGEGFPETVWSSDSEGVFALAPAAEGDVLIGTGSRGALFRLHADGHATQLRRLPSEQLVAVRDVGGAVLVAGTNPGRIFRLGGAYARRGHFDSDVKDTGSTSSWGTIRWHATQGPSTDLEIRTRSGNTATPDATWSAWSEPYRDAAGSAVTSPPARFVQWRAALSTSDTGRSPALRRVELAYVPANQPPVVDSLTVHPAGVVYRQNASFEDGLPFAQLPAPIAAAVQSDTAAASARAFLGRPFYIAGLQSFTWEASDPNGDELVYSVEFRGEGEQAWKPMQARIEGTMLVFDTTRVPDGPYRARLTASDTPSNPESTARSASRDSTAFLVDNTPPVVDAVRAVAHDGGIRLTADVRDLTSLIRQIRYSVDGAEWRTVLPADGAADSPVEHVSIELVVGAGEHTVVVQAVDTALNRGAGKVVIGRSGQDR